MKPDSKTNYRGVCVMSNLNCSMCDKEIKAEATYYRYGNNFEHTLCKDCYEKAKLRKRIKEELKVSTMG